MASCYLFSGTATNAEGQELAMFQPDHVPVENCVTVPNSFVVMTPMEYIQQKTDATALADLSNVTAFVDPVEVSAVYGTSFALMLFLTAIAYKIKVAKRVIKLA